MVEWSTTPKRGDEGKGILEKWLELLEETEELRKLQESMLVKIEYHPSMAGYLPFSHPGSPPNPFPCPLVENILIPLWTLRLHRGNGDIEQFSGTPEEFIATMAKLSGV